MMEIFSIIPFKVYGSLCFLKMFIAKQAMKNVQSGPKPILKSQNSGHKTVFYQFSCLIKVVSAHGINRSSGILARIFPRVCCHMRLLCRPIKLFSALHCINFKYSYYTIIFKGLLKGLIETRKCTLYPWSGSVQRTRVHLIVTRHIKISFLLKISY
jgi:hypothetical protein